MGVGEVWSGAGALSGDQVLLHVFLWVWEGMSAFGEDPVSVGGCLGDLGERGLSCRRITGKNACLC